MKRKEWLQLRSKLAEERMDTLFSPNYDENWGELEQPHVEMIEKLLKLVVEKPAILDAACGTGKYWHILLQKESKILGIDHSLGMLQNAQRKFPSVPIKKVKLQELTFKNQFDAIICMDAMENIFPEHWPIVLNKFTEAVKENGYIYFTVELMDEEELRINFEKSKAEGEPIVFGEFLENGGYHYYPPMSTVRELIQTCNLNIVEEFEQGVYHHFLVQKKNN